MHREMIPRPKLRKCGTRHLHRRAQMPAGLRRQKPSPPQRMTLNFSELTLYHLLCVKWVISPRTPRHQKQRRGQFNPLFPSTLLFVVLLHTSLPFSTLTSPCYTPFPASLFFCSNWGDSDLIYPRAPTSPSLTLSTTSNTKLSALVLKGIALDSHHGVIKWVWGALHFKGKVFLDLLDTI